MAVAAVVMAVADTAEEVADIWAVAVTVEEVAGTWAAQEAECVVPAATWARARISPAEISAAKTSLVFAGLE